MKKYAEIDQSALPVLNVFFTGNNANEDNFELYLSEIKQVYDQERTIAIIFDATSATLPATIYQKMQAKWLKDNENVIQKFCVGTAYIISNMVIRNVLKAIFAFQKQPVPFLVCKTMNDAILWTNQQLKTQLNNKT